MPRERERESREEGGRDLGVRACHWIKGGAGGKVHSHKKEISPKGERESEAADGCLFDECMCMRVIVFLLIYFSLSLSASTLLLLPSCFVSCGCLCVPALDALHSRCRTRFSQAVEMVREKENG